MKAINVFLILILWSLLFVDCGVDPVKKSFENKVICIDPGHGGTAESDSFRIGPSGEREEWINLRVALELSQLLNQEGAEAVLTRSEDVSVGLRKRAELAINHKADLFISIHHNATADTSVNFPIIYFHGNASENKASTHFGRKLAKSFQQNLYEVKVPVSLVSDFVIFPSSGTAVLRYAYGIPAVIGEASFFTNPAEEQRLKKENYNKKEAQAYFLAIEEFFRQPKRKILPKNSLVTLPPFPVFQEAERMDPLALNWCNDFEEAVLLAVSNKRDSLNRAYELLTRSVKSFPDSWLARQAHLTRGDILRKLGKKAEADTAILRVKEFYHEICGEK